jgi:hypothetical protein
MGVKEQVFPNGCDMQGIAADQARGQVVAQQGDHRRASRADGVGIASGLQTVAAVQGQ